jgi:hypothetical protein
MGLQSIAKVVVRLAGVASIVMLTAKVAAIAGLSTFEPPDWDVFLAFVGLAIWGSSEWDWHRSTASAKDR